MAFLDSTGLNHLLAKIKGLTDKLEPTITTLPVSKGGTGRNTLTSGQAIIGNGTGTPTFRAITATPASGSTSLFTAGGAFTLAPKASPAFTGTPTAPTPSTSDTSTNIATTSFVKAVLLAMWPIGSIYISTTDINPSTFIGGTWARWGQGQFILGVNTADPNLSNSGITGGEPDVTLTVDQMPSHGHVITMDNNNQQIGWAGGSVVSNAFSGTPGGGRANTLNSLPSGGGLPHNNLPPFITAFMWRRTA